MEGTPGVPPEQVPEEDLEQTAGEGEGEGAGPGGEPELGDVPEEGPGGEDA
jgi:hypothetical protein